MSRFLKISGIILWLYVLSKYSYLVQENYVIVIKNILIGIGIISIIILVFKLSKTSYRKAIGTLIVGAELNTSVENFLNSLPNPTNVEKANLLSAVFHRLTKVGLFTLILASIPTILLFKQNQLLDYQNSRLTQQTYLQEAERRSSLVFLFSNILDSIDDELKNDYNSNIKRDLSPQLIGRIISLSSSLKPYKYLSNDNLISNELSPERGQLLISLLSSKLDENTLQEILIKSDFNYSDLRNADLSKTNLSEARLNFSNLENANLHKCIILAGRFENANLRNANFSSSQLIETTFENSIMEGTNLSRVETYTTNFKNCNLKNSNLRYAKLNGSFFEEAILDSALVAPEVMSQLNVVDEQDSIWGRKQILDTYGLDSLVRYVDPRTKMNVYNYRLKRKNAS